MKCNTVFISSLCYHLFFYFSISNFLQSLLQRFLFSTFTCLHSIILHAILLFSNCNVSLYVIPWRRKAVPSEILVKRLYIPDCKISLAFLSCTNSVCLNSNKTQINFKPHIFNSCHKWTKKWLWILNHPLKLLWNSIIVNMLYHIFIC